ncbi:cyclase family protein [Streptomyces tubercidicus]|uniref:cyclase family protein n=1 Tax=Streptomyces tubercidicus TaxID=47759 RepID=UPI0034661C91
MSQHDLQSASDRGGPRPVEPADVLAALQLITKGKIYNLESQWWRGMPVHPAMPQFEVLTYRTPRGVRVQGDMEMLSPANNPGDFSFMTEMIMGSAHTGTHIDALCHIVVGPDMKWHGGHSADDHLGDFGATRDDAATLPAMITRGVMLDIPAAFGWDECSAGFAIGPDELQQAADRQGVEVRQGDVVLIRTGHMRHWPDTEAMQSSSLSGVSLAGATWLSERGVIAVGADNASLEVLPSGIEGKPMPVHQHLLQESGIPILEWVNPEPLARDNVSEFTFICLPLTVHGATGSMIRPIAVV